MVRGTSLKERHKVRYTAAFFETPIYSSIIREFLPKEKDCLILDLGCGDGRFLIPLLRKGYRQVVGLDSNYESLERIQDWVETNNLNENVLLIQSDALSVPFLDEAFTVILAIEVFFYLGRDVTAVLKKCYQILQNGGVLIDSEHDVEGNALIALFYEGLDGFLRSIREKKRKEWFSNAQIYTPLFDTKEWKQLLWNQGLRVESVRKVPVVPILLSYGLKKGIFDKDTILKYEKEIHSALRKLCVVGETGRCSVFASRKRNGPSPKAEEERRNSELLRPLSDFQP